MHSIRPTPPFDYDEAFSRNISWLTEREQELLRSKTVAIAGVGGVGGAHALTLARLGIGGFRLADPDTFDLVNFNRQVGATVSTLGKSKVEVMAAMVADINPSATIARHGALTEENIDAFLRGADLYVDGLDFFVPQLRQLVFARCAALGIPAITAAPLGMSVAYVVFMPGEMTFDELFGLAGRDEDDQLVRFLVGLAPAALHLRGLADPSAMSLRERQGASVGAACQLCAGVVGVEAVKILTRRGPVRAAPWCHQLDVFSGRWRSRKTRFGQRNPWFRLRVAVTKLFIERLEKRAVPRPRHAPASDIETILEAARWAPSGDNLQPWRFEIASDERLIVHSKHDPDDVFDLDGALRLLSLGGLLENVRLTAARLGRQATWTLDAQRRLTIEIARSNQAVVDPLWRCIERRQTDRRRYSRRSLTEAERAALEAAVGPDFEVRWFSDTRERWPLIVGAWLASAARMRAVAGITTLRRVVDFTPRFPERGHPSTGLGLSSASRVLSGWLLGYPAVLRLLARSGLLFGTHLETAIVPGLAAAVHFTLVKRDSAPTGDEMTLRAGAALQRFWLTATRLDLALQPNIGALALAHNAVKGLAPLDGDPEVARAGARIGDLFSNAAGLPVERIVAVGRIGEPPSPQPGTRAMRMPSAALMVRA
jgi:molybdopterin/thiamine biosynthesis adenylyltransferase/nitroreductase